MASVHDAQRSGGSLGGRSTWSRCHGHARSPTDCRRMTSPWKSTKAADASTTCAIWVARPSWCMVCHTHKNKVCHFWILVPKCVRHFLYQHAFMCTQACQTLHMYINSFFSKRPFLAKNITLAKLSPCPQKNFRGPPSSITCGNNWTYIPRNRCGLFTLHGGPCSPSPASSDTSTPKLRAHLPPVSLETRHNKSTV